MNIVMLGQLADIFTTYMGLTIGGGYEGNPLMRLAFKHLGFTGTAVLKLGVVMFSMRGGDASPLMGAITWFAPINNTILLTTTKRDK
jgi:hypothetical protein